MDREPIVFIVDDDTGVRMSTGALIESLGWQVRTHASAEEFLVAYRFGQWGCLLLDLHMPGMNGVDLLEELVARDIRIPSVIVTAHPDHPLAVCATDVGALAVLAKPFREVDLLAILYQALDKSDY